jgi:hypothetical protein
VLLLVEVVQVVVVVLQAGVEQEARLQAVVAQEALLHAVAAQDALLQAVVAQEALPQAVVVEEEVLVNLPIVFVNWRSI